MNASLSVLLIQKLSTPRTTFKTYTGSLSLRLPWPSHRSQNTHPPHPMSSRWQSERLGAHCTVQTRKPISSLEKQPGGRRGAMSPRRVVRVRRPRRPPIATGPTVRHSNHQRVLAPACVGVHAPPCRDARRPGPLRQPAASSVLCRVSTIFDCLSW